MPPLPKAACPRAGTRQPDDLFDSGQMRKYGQKCYEQGRYDRSMELLKTYNKATIIFEPYDPRDDLK